MKHAQQPVRTRFRPFSEVYVETMKDTGVPECYHNFGLAFAKLASAMSLTESELRTMETAGKERDSAERAKIAVMAAIAPVQRNCQGHFHFFMDAVRACTKLDISVFNEIKYSVLPDLRPPNTYLPDAIENTKPDEVYPTRNGEVTQEETPDSDAGPDI